MVFPRVAFANSRLHKTRKRGKHIDGRVDAFVVQLSINKYLTFSDVAC